MNSEPALVTHRRFDTRAMIALLLVVPAPTLGVLAAMYLWPGTVGRILFGAFKAWMLVLPLVWRRFVERHPMSLSPPRHGGFGVGAALGVAISAVIFATWWLLGRQWIDTEHVREVAREIGIGAPLPFIGAVLYWILVNAVLEEYVYRWFIFRQSEKLVGSVPAVVLSSTFFTVHHVLALHAQFDARVTWLASAGVFIGGVIWSWMYMRYRSIWPGYLSHAIVDVAIFVIGWKIIFG